MSPNRAAPSLALAAYAETWISGAKIVVFGDALSPLPERLLERGARLVQVYDRDAARVAEAAALSQDRRISYAPLENAGSVARDGVFDFGIVEELGAEARADDLPLAALRRALGRRGMALIAARNPEVHRNLIPASATAEEPLGYYDLYELVSQHFEEVRMLGQTAFVGYAVADFGAAEDSDVRLDTAFLPGGAEEPEWFLALVSTLPVTSEAFPVIQIPLSDVPLPAAAGEREEIARLEQALEQAEARALELEKGRSAREGAKEAQLQRDAQTVQVQRDAQAAQLQRDAHKRELEALQSEVSKREQWLKALESRAATADQRADDAQAELEQLTQRGADALARQKQLEQQLQEAARAKRTLEERQAESQRELEELRRGNGATARNFSELERRAAALSTQVDELNAQLQKAEGRSRETERQAREAERKLQEAERPRQEAERQAREAAQQLQEAERQLRELRAAGEDESGAELRELELQLVERGKEVARLTRELEQTERFGRQLIAQLEESKVARSAAQNGDAPKRELARLARRNAELEADLEAARWTISSLGANVATLSGAAPAPTPAREEGATQPRRSAD